MCVRILNCNKFSAVRSYFNTNDSFIKGNLTKFSQTSVITGP